MEKKVYKQTLSTSNFISLFKLIDNDIESDSEMVEDEVDKCRRNLMEAINER